MAVASYGCRECGRSISRIEAENGGICAGCRREGSGIPGAKVLSEPSSGPRLRPLNPAATPPAPAPRAPASLRGGTVRPILKPRATGDVPAAPRPQLKPLRLPDAPAEVAPPPAPRSAPPAVAPLPAAAAAPLAPPVVRQAPERPDLRLRRSREQEQQEVQQQSNWEVHFGRQGMRRKENIQGPFTWEELGCLVRNGTLDPTHRVRQAGTEEWQAASSVEGLFSRMNLQARQIKEERAEREAKQAREDEGGFFGPENWVLNHLGPAGGLLLMAIAAIWFFVAYQDGVIYFYPPVLFLVGLVGLFKR